MSGKQEIDATLERIKSHQGVESILILNSEGGVIYQSDEEMKNVKQYAKVITSLTTKARSVVRDLEPTNDLTFLRLRTKQHELLIAPENDYILIVVQKMNNERTK